MENMDFDTSDFWAVVACRYGLVVAYDLMMSWGDYFFEKNPPTEPDQIEYRDVLLLSRMLPSVKERACMVYGRDVFAE